MPLQIFEMKMERWIKAQVKNNNKVEVIYVVRTANIRRT
jgi:hypothetical protein